MPHASHKERLGELQHIEQHIRAVGEMIEHEHYCADILKEIQLVRAELKRLECEILQTHVDHCLDQAGKDASGADRDRLRVEILELLGTKSF